MGDAWSKSVSGYNHGTFVQSSLNILVSQSFPCQETDRLLQIEQIISFGQDHSCSKKLDGDCSTFKGRKILKGGGGGRRGGGDAVEELRHFCLTL